MNAMKKSLINFVAACMLAVSVVGCGSEASVDVAGFESNFASASGEVKELADKAAASLKAGNMREALNSINQLLAKSNDLSQAQLDAAGLAFVDANAVLLAKGEQASKVESKAKASELQNQAAGSE